ncbi:MAG: ABC transporter permease [Gemmatimonadaceae bacterium]
MLASLFADFRLALRSLAARPGFTLVAALTLALGVGANTAIFSVVNRLVLNPLPFEGGDRLAFPWRSSKDGRMGVHPSPKQIEEWKAHARTIDGIAPFGTEQIILDGENGAVEETSAGRMTDALPRLLAVRPALGRAFVAEELKADGPPVAMLGYGFWKSRFGGRRDVLGETVSIGGKRHTVVGVMPREMDLALGMLGDHDLWLPLVPDPNAFGMGAVVRRRPDVDFAAVQKELGVLGERAEEPKGFFKDWTIKVVPPGEGLGTPNTRPLLVMLGAVALVLLVACANVANLVLVRASGRRRELAIRAALGATRSRLFQQLFVESIALALLGGAAGLLAAMWGVDAIVALRPDSLTELETVALEPAVLGFGMLAALASGVLFGLAPALRAASPNLNDTLKTGAAGAPLEGRRFRAALVTGEVALSVLLLVGAGLLVRSFMRLQRTDPGYATEGLLTARVQLPEDRYADSTSRRVALEQLAARVAAVPGVTASMVGAALPPQTGIMFGEPQVEGRELSPELKSSTRIAPIIGGPEVFRVFGIRLVEGRPYAEKERDVIVVSQSMAKRFWPGESALGKRFRLGTDRWYTVVGVASEILPFGRRGDTEPVQIYFPGGSGDFAQATLVVRAAGDALALVPSLRAAMSSVDKAVPLRDVATVRAQLAKGLARERFNMALLATFAGLALLLSAVGLYGVLSYAVAQRTREIGIRMALGARANGIVRLVVAQAMRLSAAGVVIGVVGALGLGRVISSMLYEVQPRDPATLALVVALVLGTSLAAALAPARRAARVDPAEAIRAE